MFLSNAFVVCSTLMLLPTDDITHAEAWVLVNNAMSRKDMASSPFHHLSNNIHLVWVWTKVDNVSSYGLQYHQITVPRVFEVDETRQVRILEVVVGRVVTDLLKRAEK